MKNFETKESPLGGYGSFTTKSFEEGDFILDFTGMVVSPEEATPFALQIEWDIFIDWFERTPEDYVNHCCNPNCRVVIGQNDVWLVAIRHIEPNEEITFNYNTTEYDLVGTNCHFPCHCGSPECIEMVEGFKYLRCKEKKQIKNLLLPYLEKLLDEC